MDKEGVRDFTTVGPFIFLPLCPGCDFRLLQSVADSIAVLRDSALVTGWEMRGNWFFSWSNLAPQGEEVMWKLSEVLRVSVLCWPHECDYLKGWLLLGSFVHAVPELLSCTLIRNDQYAFKKLVLNPSDELLTEVIWAVRLFRKLKLFTVQKLGCWECSMQNTNFALHFSKKNFWQKRSFAPLKCSRNSNTTALNSETTFDQMQTEVLEKPVFSSRLQKFRGNVVSLYGKNEQNSRELWKVQKRVCIWTEFLKHCRIKPVLLPPKLE